jgi:PAS domain S-box-containing protein
VADEERFIAALASGEHDLVLSDFELPGFTGLQALAHAQRLAPRLPFVFVSGVIGEDNAVELMKQGATDYVSKGRLARLPVVIDRALREAQDRNARLAAERQLREAGEVFARVVDALQNYAVILLDTQGIVRSWNRAARTIFGFDAEEMIGVSADVLFVPSDRVARVFASELRVALANGKADDSRWMMRADATRLWAEGAVTPLFDDDGTCNGYCKVVHDATAAHEHAAALQAAKEDAERANLAKDRFMAMLSHELRTPLAPIASAAHILARCATVPEKYRALLPMIERNVALEARLIEDLLDLTALSAGKVILRSGPVDMHRLLQSVAEMLAEPLRI